MYKNIVFINVTFLLIMSLNTNASPTNEHLDSWSDLNLTGDQTSNYFSSLCVVYRELPFCPGNNGGEGVAKLEQSTWWDYNGQVFRGNGNGAIARRRVKFFRYHRYGSHWRGRGNRHDRHHYRNRQN